MAGRRRRPRRLGRTAEESGLDRARVGELLDRYGTTASRIAGHAAASDADRLPGTTDVSLREIDWILRHEHVVHLDDLVKRRTTLAIAGGLAGADIDRIADHAVAVLGWPKDRKTAEVEALRRLLRERHMMPLPTAPT